MTDRIPTKILDNGAIRMEIFNELSESQGYIWMKRADEPEVNGTSINKASLLKDSTSLLYGLDPEISVPDDIFSFVGNYLKHWWIRRSSTVEEEWEYIQSTNENTYPKYGVLDGYEYQYLGKPLERLPISLKTISSGYYIGTGIYGASNKNTIPVESTPVLTIITGGTFMGIIFTPTTAFQNDSFLGASLTLDTSRNNYNTTYKLTVNYEDGLISWYTSGAAEYQLNQNGTEYIYSVIGY